MIFDVSDNAYDRFMGRYSVRLAPLFADFARVEPGMRVLDVGAGTGALAAELVRRVGEDNVAAGEPSSKFVQALRARMPGVDVKEAPAEELPWPDESFDVALAQLVVSFASDAPRAAREMGRVVRGGGVVALCTWDRDGMEMLAALRRVRLTFERDAPDTEAAMLYRTEAGIHDLLTDAGFHGVETTLLEVDRDYSGFDELWDSVLGGVGPAGIWVLSLDDEHRAAAREELHRQVGSPSGAFTLRGSAWAARATRA